MSLPYAGDPDWRYQYSKPLLGIFTVLTYSYLPNPRIVKNVAYNWQSKHITSVVFQDKISKQERLRLQDILNYITIHSNTTGSSTSSHAPIDLTE